jgi:hypothetical protein
MSMFETFACWFKGHVWLDVYTPGRHRIDHARRCKRCELVEETSPVVEAARRQADAEQAK